MEQEEAIGVLPRTEAQVEIENALAGGRQNRPVFVAHRRRRIDEIAEDREMDVRIQVALRQHLQMLEQRLARRRRWPSSVGTTTIVRAVSGTPSAKSRRRQPTGTDPPRDQPLHDRDGEIERRQHQERERDRAGGAESAIRVGRGPGRAARP